MCITILSHMCRGIIFINFILNVCALCIQNNFTNTLTHHQIAFWWRSSTKKCVKTRVLLVAATAHSHTCAPPPAAARRTVT